MNQNIHIIYTEDGSPTAYFDDFKGEKMHHSGGAFGESVYIYGPAIQWGFAKIEKPAIASVGTGLAYNEIITAAMSLIFESDFTLQSFEKNFSLNESLIAWLMDDNKKTLVEKPVYDVILKMASELFELPSEKIKSVLKTKYENSDWKILGELPEGGMCDAGLAPMTVRDVPQTRGFQLNSPFQKYNVILYDLFSSKAMSIFWSEEFLTKFLKTNATTPCVLSTYACTGNLRRACKNNDFIFTQRTGYLWKRNSSFAVRSSH